MKKLFLALIASIALCGSVMAQHPDPYYTGLNHGDYDSQEGFVGAVIIDGEYVDVDYEGWDNLEIVAFVGEQQRSYAMWLNDEFVLEWGDPYPVTWLDAIFYTTPGELVHFKVYDHSRGIEYTDCVTLQDGEPVEILTGEEHSEGWDEDPSHCIFISCTSSASTGLTLDIDGVGEENWADQNYRGGYYLIASPVVEEVYPSEANGFIISDYDLYSFDQGQELEWINRKSDGIIQHGEGYLYASLEDTQLRFEGTTYDEDPFVKTLDYTEDNPEEGMRGWNLVGNPFAETAYIQESVSYYIINPDGRADLIVGEEIAPMNAVFVQATADGQTLTFTTQDRGKSPRLSLNVSNGRAVVDRAAVNFKQGQALPKFQLNPNHTKVYIPMDGKDYAVVSSEGVGEMPVNFKAESNGIYTLSYTNEEVSFGYLHLIDNMTGADTDLLETPSYTFNAKTTDYASRFKLVYATGSAEDESFAFFSNGNWIINNEGAATLQVVDVTGRVLSSETFSGSIEKKLDVAPSVYLLRLINGNDVKVQKMVVR